MTAPSNEPFTDIALADSLDGDFTSHHAHVNGVDLHYVEGGSGEPLLLLGGWPQTWWQWHKIMPQLARRHRVIAVDLRGMGASAKPAAGYDKKTMAGDIHGLLTHLGLSRASVVGHDIGAMVAYAFAANYPRSTARIALLDVPHPDEGWTRMPLLPGGGQDANAPAAQRNGMYLWWFAFNQVHGLPEQLLDGRAGIFIDWLVGYMANDPDSIDEHSREVYARAYSTPDAIRGGNGWYQTFTTDIADEQTYEPVAAPLLALGGDRANYPMLRDVMPAKGTDVRVREIADCGHYLPEEQPAVVVEELESFLG